MLPAVMDRLDGILVRALWDASNADLGALPNVRYWA